MPYGGSWHHCFSLSEPVVPEADRHYIHTVVRRTVGQVYFRSPGLADAVGGYPGQYPCLGAGRQEGHGEQEDGEEHAELHVRCG